MSQKWIRYIKEKCTSYIFWITGIMVIIIFSMIFFTLCNKSASVLSKFSWRNLLFTSTWNPSQQEFGFWPAIVGTFYVTMIAMIIATPLSILTAIYISEYAPQKRSKFLSSFIDVLAGVPSVVYGICALQVLVPLVANYIGPLLGIRTTGLCIFTAGITLAIMVLPIIISLTLESLKMLPLELREECYSLGATRQETITTVLLRAASPGITAAILLGFGRAFGETMAVAMVVGGRNKLAPSLFSAGQTLPSLIVSSFGEMMSIPLQQSALLFVALVLTLVVTGVNILAQIIKLQLQKRWKI